MRVCEDNQQSTSCFQTLFPNLQLMNQRKVLSDKKIKKEKKINLSLVENNHISSSNPIQKNNMKELLTKSKKKTSKKLTISSSIYKKTPATQLGKNDKELNFDHNSDDKNYEIVNIDWASIQKCRRKRDSWDMQAEKRDSYNLKTNRMSRKLNGNTNRRISMINNDKHEHQDEVHRIAQKKAPVFFSQKIDDLPKKNSKPYLSLWSEPHNLSQSQKEKYDHLTNKKPAELNNQTATSNANQQILSILEQLKRSLQLNQKNRMLQQGSEVDQEDMVSFPFQFRSEGEQPIDHTPQLINPAKMKPEECFSIEQASQQQNNQSVIKSQKSLDNQIRNYGSFNKYETQSTKKGPLKRLIDGAQTIVSNYDDSGQKESVAYSSVIFRINGQGEKYQYQHKDREQTLENDGNRSGFKKRFGYSYKDNHKNKQAEQPIFNRKTCNADTFLNCNKKMIFSESKQRQNHHQEPNFQSVTRNFDTYENQPESYSVGSVNSASSQFRTVNQGEYLQSFSDTSDNWRKHIEQIYVDNCDQNQFEKSCIQISKSLSSFQSSHQQTDVMPNKFTKIKYLGVGRYSSVYLFVDPNTNFTFALKQIFKFLIEPPSLLQLFQQIYIQKSIKHPNIVDLYGAFQDQKKYCMILEYAGDSLYRELQSKGIVSESQCILYVRDIALGLKYLHSNRIAHRDIKPENIMLIGGVCKIGDFGCVGILSQGQRYFNETKGTPVYISPQIDQLKEYTVKTDCWSLGVLAFELRTGKLTISDKQPIRESNYLFKQNDTTSAEYKSMVSMLLQQQENKRLSIDELLELPLFANFEHN